MLREIIEAKLDRATEEQLRYIVLLLCMRKDFKTWSV